MLNTKVTTLAALAASVLVSNVQEVAVTGRAEALWLSFSWDIWKYHSLRDLQAEPNPGRPRRSQKGQKTSCRRCRRTGLPFH